MLVLTSAAQAQALAHRLPAVAVARMVAFEGDDGRFDPDEHGAIYVLEEGDDIERDFPMIGEYGLLTHLDDEWQAPFDYVYSIREEDGRRIFEAVIPLAGDAAMILIVPDEPWLDSRLRLVLDVEAVEDSSPLLAG